MRNRQPVLPAAEMKKAADKMVDDEFKGKLPKSRSRAAGYMIPSNFSASARRRIRCGKCRHQNRLAIRALRIPEEPLSTLEDRFQKTWLKMGTFGYTKGTHLKCVKPTAVVQGKTEIALYTAQGLFQRL